MKIKVDFRKIVSVIATAALLFNSVAPFSVAIAQEVTPEPTPTETVAPTDNPTATPDATPAETASPDPVVTSTPTDLVTPTPTETPVVTQAPESNQTVQGPPADSITPTPSPTTAPTPTPVPTPLVTSDKADYHPGETATISGSFFNALEDLVVKIFGGTVAEGNYTESSHNVTTDAAGNFSLAYTLDNIFRPLYTTQVYGATTTQPIASTTFTDTASPLFSWPASWNNYLVNGNPVYDDEAVGSHSDPSNGGTGVNPSEIDIASGSCSDTTNPGGKVSVLTNLTSDANYQFYRMRLSGDPRANGNSGPAYSSYHWDILLDTDHNGYANFIVDLFGDTISVFAGTNTSNAYSPVSPLWSKSATKSINDYTEVVQDFNGSCHQYFLDYAIPVGAFGSVGLSTLQNANLFFSTSASNTDPLQKDWMGFAGFIFGIAKQVSTDGTTWGESSTVTAGTQVYFKVTLTNTGNVNITGVSLQDTLPSGFSYVSGSTTGATISNPGIVGQLLTWSGLPAVNAGGSLSLTFRATTPQVTTQTTFTNTSSAYIGTQLLGSDTADVIVNPANGTLTVHKTFTDSRSNSGITINISGDATTSGTTNGSGNAIFTLNPGTYSATATEPDGYYESGNTCSSVSVSAGNNTSCTITDSPITGTITVHKDLVGTNIGDGLNNFCFTLSPDPSKGQICADAVTGNAVFTNVPKGDYTASETQKLDTYTQTATTCDQTMSIVNNGDSKSCTVTNTRNTGTIELKKIWSGTPGQTTLNIGNSAGGTSVTSVTTGTNGAAPLTTGIKTVNTGAYYVSETGGLTNYTPALDCTDNGQPFAPGTNNSFTVVKDHAYVCTFTNTRNQGTITIVKNVIGGNDTFNFTVDGNTSSTPSINTNVNSTWGPTPIDTGSYTVNESAAPTGWNQSGYLCMKGNVDLNSNSFTIDKGENVTCTFTNTKAGSIVLKKEMVGGTDSFDFTGTPSWLNKTLSVDNNWTWTFNNVTPKVGTAYKISENVKAGWDLTGLSCDDGSSSQPSVIDPTSGNTLDIYVDPGETVTCTFTNTKHATITVHKITDPADDPQSFPISIATTSGQIFGGTTGSISTSSDKTFEVKAGTYSVSEDLSNLPGWQLNLNGCTSVTVVAGQDGVCNIYNNKLSSLSGFKFKADGTTPIMNWTINLLTCTALGVGCVQSNTTTTDDTGFYSFSNLVAGFYQVAEYVDSLYTPVLGITTHDLNVTNGSTITDQNFSNFKNINIQVCKKSDADGNIATTGDRAFLSGWSITLNIDGVPTTTQTTQSAGENRLAGCTTFTNLGPGHVYSATEEDRAGWTSLTGLTHNFDAPSDGLNQTFTFINTQLGSIQGRKYNDVNGNGDFDTSEKIDANKLNGWTINLYNGDALVKSMVTGDDSTEAGSVELGQYKFVNLLPGTYEVCEESQTGWTQTEPASGNKHSENTNCHTVTVAAGQAVDTIQFGNFQLGQITACKYKDLNGNGRIDEVDPTMSGVMMNLYNDGDGWLLQTSHATGDNGCYTFTGLTAGNYKVTENSPEGFYQTSPAKPDYFTQLVQSGTDVTFNFLNAQFATLGDTIYEDSNISGAQDPGEPGIAGVSVDLYKDDGDGFFEPGADDPFIGTQVTGGTGQYLFTDLIAGTYWVTVDNSTLPSGFTITTSNDPFEVILPPGDTNLNADFGYVAPKKEITLEKSNDSPHANAGSTVTYTLKVKNNGNVDLHSVIVTDYLPGGFTYVSGSTTGASEPAVIGNKLAWDVGFLGADESITIKYQAKISSDSADGIYTNFATCTSQYWGSNNEEVLTFATFINRDGEVVECKQVSSDVTLGSGQSYGGNLQGQVLGASTELPATGSPTELLLISLAILGLGIFLNGYTMRKQKAALKKVVRKSSAKRKVKRHAKK